MTWYFWLTLGLFVASFLGWRYEYHASYDGPFWGPVAAFVTGIALLVLGAHHAILTHHDQPGAPQRTCLVQQLQEVQHGKTTDEEWVCIGWAQ